MKTYSNSDIRWQLRANLITYWRQALEGGSSAFFYFSKYHAAREALMLSHQEAVKLVDLYRSYTRAS